MTNTALITRLNSEGNPASKMPVLIVWMIIAPSSQARMEIRPPPQQKPPLITTAKIASSSSHRPALLASAPRISAVAMMPASAAQNLGPHVSRDQQHVAVDADGVHQKTQRGAPRLPSGQN